MTAQHVLYRDDAPVDSISVINSEGQKLSYRVLRELDHIEAALLIPKGGPVRSEAVRIAISTTLGEPIFTLGYLVESNRGRRGNGHDRACQRRG